MEPQTRPPTWIKALLLQGNCNITPELLGRDFVPVQLHVLTLVLEMTKMSDICHLPHSDIALDSYCLPLNLYYREEIPLHTFS